MTIYISVIPNYNGGMKLSISLSKWAGERLEALVKGCNSNPSLVLEASLLRFAALPEAEQLRDIGHLHQARKATTRDGWMRVFWEAVAEEFDSNDFELTGQGNPVAPRSHHGFDMVFLYDERNPISGPIYVHVFQSPPPVDNRALMQNWTFTKDDPVYGAARKVANWIRENEHSIQPATVR